MYVGSFWTNLMDTTLLEWLELKLGTRNGVLKWRILVYSEIPPFGNWYNVLDTWSEDYGFDSYFRRAIVGAPLMLDVFKNNSSRTMVINPLLLCLYLSACMPFGAQNSDNKVYCSVLKIWHVKDSELSMTLVSDSSTRLYTAEISPNVK